MKPQRKTAIQFDKAKLNAEVAKCRESQMAALTMWAGAIFKKRYGLNWDDAPPELLHLALGRTNIHQCLEGILKALRKEKRTVPDEYWFWLLKVISDVVKCRGPISDDELRKAKEDRKNDLALIRRWVAPADHPDFIQGSLCFYAWDALAKTVYLLDWKQPPRDRWKAEAVRIKKQSQRLGLRHSELHLIRDVEVKPDGTIIPVPFKQTLAME